MLVATILIHLIYSIPLFRIPLHSSHANADWGSNIQFLDSFIHNHLYNLICNMILLLIHNGEKDVDYLKTTAGNFNFSIAVLLG
jgi:hypothetical protein